MKQAEAGWNPVFSRLFWTPAFAGVTKKWVLQRSLKNFLTIF
jgi:hypothetical protein